MGQGVRVPHLLMAAASVAVLGLAVYLFVEVKKAPAAPSVIAAAAPHEVPPTDVPPPVKVPDSPPETKRDRHLPPPPTAAPDVAPVTTAARPVNDEPPKVDVNTDAIMDEANKAYDKQDFDEARAAAGRVLATQPNNTRMLRIMVSAACIEVDAAEANKWFPKLAPDDQKAMRTRCTRYGVTFPDAK